MEMCPYLRTSRSRYVAGLRMDEERLGEVQVRRTSHGTRADLGLWDPPGKATEKPGGDGEYLGKLCGKHGEMLDVNDV